MLFLFVGVVLYLYDQDRSDEELTNLVQRGIQEDFEACITHYRTTPTPLHTEQGNACTLKYGREGRLLSWSNSQFLPGLAEIDFIDKLTRSPLVRLQNHFYYQVRRPGPDHALVILIPLHITYEVYNEFLDPYLFLGRWRATYERYGRHELMRRIRVHPPDFEGEADIEITDVEGKSVFRLSRVPLMPLRMGVRYAVVIFWALGAFCTVVFLRIYTLKHWPFRYWINLALASGILILRSILYWLELPGDYLDSELFSPKILAFHDLASSLGDLTINIFTLAALVWVLYTHFFRLSNLLFRRLLRNHWLAWPAMIISIGISSLLMAWYIDVFEQITLNSQVDIEFSNLFKTDFYSYLILIDVGTLWLALSMVMFILLRLNMLYLCRYGCPWLSLSVQALLVVGFNYFLHQSAPAAILLSTVSLLLYGLVIYRLPFGPILKQDLVNYLLITIVASMLVTYNVVLGVRISKRHRAQQIAERVLSSPTTNTLLNYDKAISRVESDMEEIRAKRASASDFSDFRDWLNENYLRANFKGFNVCLFLYDSTGQRLDSDPDIVPTFGLEHEFPLSERGGIQLSRDHPLYQIPNPTNEIVDIFVSSFELYLGPDSTEQTQLLLELVPTSREVRGLYPSLSMEQSVYDDVKLINSFDHAIYRKGVLYTKRGKSVFPVHMPDYKDFEGKTNRTRGEHQEYLEPIDAERLVVVRYSQQSPLEILTTFSFIFYFFSIGSLILIGLPVLLMRAMRTHPLGHPIPLRDKIRLGLISISVMPMLVIMALLYPFVSDRYHEEARETLSEETLRILSAIEPAYHAVLRDPLHRISTLRDFRQMIRNLEGVVSNDINVFDRNGVRIATTQPLITELGIRTDLMNEVALDSLRQAGLSDLVVREKIGNLEYLSGYRPILGKQGIPVGFVNVPYLGRQDQLQEQVVNFLSYLANIYLLAFLMINVVAVGISSTITKPLTLVQQGLSATTLGNVNQHIDYQSKDEIGAIVKAYNQMITQLEQSEQKLAQSEREMAWRQMARQVAHEIKNPLTPMRLNIQHLMRAWKEQSPRLEKMFPKVMTSLMVQIDSLVRIANSFHEFAKMPEPNKTHLRLNEVLLEVVDLYTQSEGAIWLIDIPQAPFWTHADRDQLSRCFNNIIKNALQSLEDNGIIHVSMRTFEDRARVEIKDNGKGMSPEVQKKIFEPSFSTKTSGMGLGLAIVRRIIENAGGSISFRSEEGVGTTFFVELPHVEAPAPKPKDQPNA